MRSESSSGTKRSERTKRVASEKFWSDLKGTELHHPTTITELGELLPSEASARDYLTRLRWQAGFVCPKCNAKKAWVVPSRGLAECEQGHQTSVTAGTVLHKTRLPLRTWIYAVWFMTTHKNSMSAVQFQHQLGIRKYKSSFNLLHKIRDTIATRKRRRLSGTVEVDEFYVGGPEEGKGRAGRGALTKVLVVAAVEVVFLQDRNENDLVVAGRCSMQIVPDATADSLRAFVEQHVEPGAKIATDAHRGYWWIDKEREFDHDVTVAKRTKDPLPTLGKVVTNFKRWWIGTHKGAIRAQHLQSYLDEYVYRFNRRRDRHGAFVGLLELLVRPAR